MLVISIILTSVIYGTKSQSDNSPSCCGWATLGECENNAQFMLANCPRACGPGCTEAEMSKYELPSIGTDKELMCCWWAQKGECSTNPSYMRPYCQKSCGTSGCTIETSMTCTESVDVTGCPWDDSDPPEPTAPEVTQPSTDPQKCPTTITKQRLPVPANRKAAFEEIAQIMKGTMDPSVDPCDDFYMHACGNAGGANPTMTQLKSQNIKIFLTEIFTDAAMPEDFQGDAPLENAFKQIQSLYQSASNVDYASQGMQDIVEDLGGIAFTGSAGYFNPYMTALSLEMMWGFATLTEENWESMGTPLLTVTLKDDEYITPGYNSLIFDLTPPDDPTIWMDAVVGYWNTHNEGRKLTRDDLMKAYNAFLDDALNLNKQQSVYTYGDVENDVPDLADAVQTLVPGKNIWGDIPVRTQAVDLSAFSKVVKDHERIIQDMLIGYFIAQFYDASGVTGGGDLQSDLMILTMGYMEPRFSRLMRVPENILMRTYAHYHGPNTDKDDQVIQIRRGVERIRSALMKRVLELEWLDATSKTRVLDKLNAIVVQIANPDWILENPKLSHFYKELPPMEETEYFAIMRNFAVNRWKYAARKLSLVALRKSETFIGNTFDINSQYNPWENVVSIFQGWMVDPSYNPLYPIELRAGPLGETIAHELTHSIDASGTTYGRRGILRDVLTPESRANFKRASSCLQDMYSSFCMPLGVCIGNEAQKKMLDIVADYGGARYAFYALVDAVKRGAEIYEIPGFENKTVEQMFFYGHATSYCQDRSVWSDKETLLTFLEDEHPNDYSRVNGTLQNFPEFAKAFNCPDRSKMKPAPEKLCPVW